MRPGTPALIAAVALAPLSTAFASEPAVRHIRPDRQAGTSAAVVVPAETPLLFSTQVVAPAHPGAASSPERVASEALDRLDHLLGSGGSGLDRAVRLHAVLDGPELLPALRSSLAARFPDADGPSLTVVVGALPRPGARIALDAVATTDRTDAGPIARASGPLSVLPGGPRVLVAGQAEEADDLADATRKTLESLRATLEHLGIGTDRVIQLKAFYTPAGSAEVVEREVVAFFGGAVPPPLVLVEWESTLPIEIELVAAAPEPGSDRPIDYLDTPALPASPIFSRVARVNGGDLVFTSGLFGPGGGTGTAQVEAIFSELTDILAEAGSDLDHLAKATYYVSADDSSQALNALRPNYYDPSRPPAASKAQVPGVGFADRSITVDMIAVAPARSADRP